MKKILFVTWDGLEVQYIEGLFLSIFIGLIKQGYQIEVLQFTWANIDAIKRVKNKLNSFNVSYTEVYINKKMPFNSGYIFAIFSGIYKIRCMIRADKFITLMPRSILPSLISLVASASIKDVALVYDSDGFPHDERIDFQGWSATGLPYQFYRFVEFMILRKSHSIITRSKKAKEIIISRAGSKFDSDKVFVIWNGRDSKAFKLYSNGARIRLRESLNILPHHLVFLYSGSIGEKYLTHTLLTFFAYLSQRNPNCRIVILTTQLKELKSFALKEHLSLDNFIIESVAQEKVCDYLNIADFGLFFCKEAFSTTAVFPTKLSEYLLTGLPSIISKGIGDCDEIASYVKGIYTVSDYTDKSFNEILDWAENTQRVSASIRIENERYAKQQLTTDKTIEIITKAIEYQKNLYN